MRKRLSREIYEGYVGLPRKLRKRTDPIVRRINVGRRAFNRDSPQVQKGKKILRDQASRLIDNTKKRIKRR